jgi:hypothetical protein
MPREDRRVLNIKQDSINEIDYYPSSQTVADGDMVISHPKGKTLRLYKKLKGMLWWNDFTKDGNQTVEKNLEVKGKINDISMGTSAVPDGGIGFAKFAMSGTTTNADGPHVQYTTSADSYPVFQQLNWGHDNISLNFDAYYDGAWKSSDLGSNFQLYKLGDNFKLAYDSSVAQGYAVTWNNGIIMDTSGRVGIPTINTSHKLNVTGTAGLSTGTAWTNTSDVRIKTNVETITGGLDKINQLRPVSFNYISDYTDIHQEIDASKKYNSFIANEYAEVFPDAVSVGGNLERITPSSDIGEPNEVEVLIEDLLQFTPHDLHVYLVKAVQELSAKVTALENK